MRGDKIESCLVAENRVCVIHWPLASKVSEIVGYLVSKPKKQQTWNLQLLVLFAVREDEPLRNYVMMAPPWGSMIILQVWEKLKLYFNNDVFQHLENVTFEIV